MWVSARTPTPTPDSDAAVAYIKGRPGSTFSGALTQGTIFSSG